MRILVTGAAGFIGSNFVRKCASEYSEMYSEILCVDKLTYAGNWNNLSNINSSVNITKIYADICDFEKITLLLDDVDVVVNFAAESHVDRSISNPVEFFKSNVLGVQTLLDACKNSGVKKIIQISTDEVYGSILRTSANESFNLFPNSPYAASKASADLIVRSYVNTYGMNIVTTRCSNNYGPYQNREKFIPTVITNLLRGNKIPIYGLGNNVREWIHVEDHCEAIFKVIQSGVKGEIYNIGSGKEVDNMTLAKMILNIMDISEDRIEYVTDRAGHDLRYSLDSNKIKSELNFKCKVDFEKGLKSTVNWYLKNEDFWK